MKNGFYLLIAFYIMVITAIAVSVFQSDNPKEILNEHPVIVIDGCEYFNGSVLVHKGNCTNHVKEIK